jgi:hypothetical protein
MAVLGHRTLEEAERYTRDADQKRLSVTAIARLEARNANETAQTSRSGLGKPLKRKGKST